MASGRLRIKTWLNYKRQLDPIGDIPPPKPKRSTMRVGRIRVKKKPYPL
jgi:hypothetical protein